MVPVHKQPLTIFRIPKINNLMKKERWRDRWSQTTCKKIRRGKTRKILGQRWKLAYKRSIDPNYSQSKHVKAIYKKPVNLVKKWSWSKRISKINNSGPKVNQQMENKIRRKNCTRRFQMRRSLQKRTVWLIVTSQALNRFKKLQMNPLKPENPNIKKCLKIITY